MKKLPYLLAGALLFACQNSTDESSAEAETVAIPKYSIEQFYESDNVGGGFFNSDESKLLINSNETGIWNAYEIDLSDGSKRALTSSTEESTFGNTYVPGTDEVILSADKGGNELDHLYLLKADGSQIDLTPGENEKAGFGGWSKDDQHMYYISNKRDPNYFDLYKMKVGDWTAELLYQNDEGVEVGDISDDEMYFSYSQSITTSENRLFLKNMQSGETIEISNPEEKAAYGSSGFSDDNQYFYYTTDLGKEFRYLVAYNIAEGSHETLFETNWNVSYSYLSETEKYRIIAINEDGRTKMIIQDNASGEAIDFPEIPDANIDAVSMAKSESKIRLSVSTSKAPNNIYVYDMASGDLQKLTETLNPEINAEHLVAAEVVRYPSFDGLEIPAIYYKPLTASSDNKVPALVWVHGGPGGQSRVGYFGLIQYLVNQGYAVLAVNNRGSSGYGKTFYRMDDQNHGDKDLQDCIYGKKWLQSQDYIDSEKIGIIGGSYGGYMTMAAMTFTPDEFEVGVNIFGVTNWIRTLKSIPSYWAARRDALFQELGNPFTEDSVRLHEISPLFHAEQVKNPIMVLQGANDPRVLQIESDEIVAAVKENGIPVEYVVFPDEGHGFLKKENEINGYGKIVEFLDQYLKGQTPLKDEAS